MYAPPIAPDPSSRRAATVLVVDDDPRVARTVQRMLIAAGYHAPATVTDPSGLESALATTRPDLVLLDIDLGRGAPTGIELTARLPVNLPFVFMSAHADDQTLARAGERLPAGFVVKPFERLQLIAAVDIALATSRRASDRPLPVHDLPELAALTAREREVVALLMDNKRARAIARTLFLSEHTVRNHLRNIFVKLEVRSQQALLDLVSAATAKRR